MKQNKDKTNFGAIVAVFYQGIKRMIKYLYIFVFFTISIAASAQAREDFDQSRRSELAGTIHIFPNPAVDFVHVRLDRFTASQVKITMHNIIGNQVEVETEIVDEHEIRVRVKDLASGYYLLALKDDEDRFKGTYKILKR